MQIWQHLLFLDTLLTFWSQPIQKPKNLTKDLLKLYLGKLAHVQVVINCQYSIAHMCTWEDTHARLFMRAVLDDVMSQNELTT